MCVCFSFNVRAETVINSVFKYEITDGFVEITGAVDTENIGNLVIPAVIDGYKVKRIGDYAFSSCDIKNLTVENGITEIGSYAFSDCKNLESVVLSDDVEVIGSNAFAFCDKLSEFKCPASLKRIETSAFTNCLSLKQIEFNEGLEEISSGAISKCDSLREVVIPSTVKTLSISGTAPAIEYCDELETIVLKCTLDQSQIFVADCPNLKNVIFENDIGDFDYSTGMLKYNFYECKPRIKSVNAREYTVPMKINICGKKESNIERFASENGFTFTEIKDNTYDLSQNDTTESIISPWAEPEVESAIELGFVPLAFRDNYKRNITRADFAKLAMFFLSVQYGYTGVSPVQLWSEFSLERRDDIPREFINAYCHSKKDRNGNRFKDCSGGTYDLEDPSIIHYDDFYYNNNHPIYLPSATFQDLDDYYSEGFYYNATFIDMVYNIGIMNGISEDEFNPGGEITRQEAAAILMRVYRNYAETEESDYNFKFSDDEDIADWAKSDVYDLNALGAMQGVEKDVFSPHGKYTVEQAIVTFWRLYDSAPISRKNKNVPPLLDHEFELNNFFAGLIHQYFHIEDRMENEKFVILCGFWTRYHSHKQPYMMYVFDKNGGVPYKTSLTEDMKWSVSPDGNIITTYGLYDDTFQLYNKLYGTDKVYDKGVYKTEYDFDHEKILSFKKAD